MTAEKRLDAERRRCGRKGSSQLRETFSLSGTRRAAKAAPLPVVGSGPAPVRSEGALFRDQLRAIICPAIID